MHAPRPTSIPAAAARGSMPPLLHASVFFLLMTVLIALPLRSSAQSCIGDCNNDGTVMVDELIRAINQALAVMLVEVPCPAADADRDGEITINELILAVNNALVGCPVRGLAFVVATDFTTGSFGTISLDPPRQVQPASPARRINADATARAFDGLVYVINRFLADNIQVLDPARDFATVWQCSTAPGTNPHDIAILDQSRAYVTRYDVAELLVVNPSVGPDCSGFTVETIDLSPFADADGIPEMDQMALVDGLLYVAVQKLDRNNFFSPTGPGGIVVIDTATNQPIDEITLSGGDPLAATKGLTVIGNALVVAETGSFGVTDGGIERVNLVTRTAEGFFITEAELGGDITDFVLVSGDIGYAVVSKPDFTNNLVAFDPTKGIATRTILDSVQYIPDIELNDRGELFASDRTTGHSGIRILRARDGVDLTDQPIDLGLPPFEMVFVR
jgi:hypothetical protein